MNIHFCCIFTGIFMFTLNDKTDESRRAAIGMAVLLYIDVAQICFDIGVIWFPLIS